MTVTSGSTSFSTSQTLRGCSTPGGTVTATLRQGTSTIATDTHTVTVAVPVLPSPPAPSGLEVTSITSNSISLAWNTRNGVSKYRVQYGSITHETTSISPRVSGLQSNTSYTFQVSGYGDGSTYRAAWGSAASVSKTTLPAIPTGLQSTTDDGTIMLTWNDVDGATEYEVQRATGTGSPLDWSTLPSSHNSPPATFGGLVNGLTNGVVYHHRVRSVGTAGKSDWSLGHSTILPLAGPVILDVVPLPNREARLSWLNSDNNIIGTTFQVQHRERAFATVFEDSSEIEVGSGPTTDEDPQSSEVPTLPTIEISGLPSYQSLGERDVVSNRFKVEAELLAPATLYRITVRARGYNLGFDNRCIDKAITKLQIGGATRLLPTLYACGPTSGTVVAELAEVQWSDWTDVESLGTGIAGYNINLDSMFADDTLDEIRVQAIHPQGLSGFVGNRRPVAVIDTPITKANGDSKGFAQNNGQAALEWTPLQEIVGPVQGRVSFRYRQMGDYNGISHTSIGWRPENFGVPTTTRDNPITGLTFGEVYAIQFIFQATTSQAGIWDATKVYAGRDSFVWPWNESAAHGDEGRLFRVASFPLRLSTIGRIQGGYSYIFCEESFPEMEREDWSRAVHYAFKQWESASNGLVEVNPLRNYNPYENGGVGGWVGDPCASYQSVTEETEEDITKYLEDHDSLTTGDFNDLRSLAHTLVTNGIRPQDLAHHEVKMVDVEGTFPGLRTQVPSQRDPFVGSKWSIFEGLAKYLGVHSCIFLPDKKSCTVPRPIDDTGIAYTIDILLNQNHTDVGINPPDPLDDDIRFNRCPSTMNNRIAYHILVHEAGHALGILADTSNFIPERVNHHPLHEDSKDTVMSDNHEDVYRCSPHPLDLLAMYALYQTE